MTVVLFLTNLDSGEDNYVEIETSTEELGIRPVSGDYISMGDSLSKHIDDDPADGIKYSDFYEQEFLVRKCIISEMDILFCHCFYKSS